MEGVRHGGCRLGGFFLRLFLRFLVRFFVGFFVRLLRGGGLQHHGLFFLRRDHAGDLLARHGDVRVQHRQRRELQVAQLVEHGGLDGLRLDDFLLFFTFFAIAAQQLEGDQRRDCHQQDRRCDDDNFLFPLYGCAFLFTLFLFTHSRSSRGPVA